MCVFSEFKNQLYQNLQNLWQYNRISLSFWKLFWSEIWNHQLFVIVFNFFHLLSIIFKNFLGNFVLQHSDYNKLKNQTKKTKKKGIERKSQWNMKVYTAFLVTCVGYHDDSYKQTMLGLYTYFSWKMIENHMNMVPNALLTKKWVVLRASHVNLIITFVMHNISVP